MRHKSRFSMRAGIGALALSLSFVIGGAQAATWDGSYFPNLVLTTQEGKSVRFYDDLLKGKRFIINLMYTSCVDSFPLETARLSLV